MIVRSIKTRIFKEGEDLAQFITEHIKTLSEKSVLVITSKIVALSEKRTAIIKDVRSKEKIIKRESDFALPTRHVWMTIKENMVMASAGIDESNADGKVILLPKDSYKAAKNLLIKMKSKYKVRELAILITDSRTLPFRSGVTGVALGYAGLKGIKDYAGKEDIFGRKFKFSKVNMADSLATAAVLTMGEGAEQMPLAVIKGVKVEFTDKVDRDEVAINIEDDMYLPMISKYRKFKK